MLKLVLIVLSFLAVSSASTQPKQAPQSCNFAPAIASDFPDPSILHDFATGDVFAYATNAAAPGGGLLNTPVSRAANLHMAAWSAPVDALPQLPRWARGSYTWAPAIVHRAGEPYRLYFTARYGYSNRPCIGVAISQSPTGPFTSTSQTKPLVCPIGEGGAIDPSVFEEGDGSEYLLWKTDANCCQGAPTLYIQQLSQDGLSLAGPQSGDGPWLLPDATPLIHADQTWEGGVIEAPTLRKHDGRYYLFYSGGDYATNRYAIGYASAASLLGPYRKANDPILTSSMSGLQGPGGQDVFDDPDGETWIAFHAWQGVRPSRFRTLYFGHLLWKSDGPIVAPECSTQSATAP